MLPLGSVAVMSILLVSKFREVSEQRLISETKGSSIYIILCVQVSGHRAQVSIATNFSFRDLLLKQR